METNGVFRPYTKRIFAACMNLIAELFIFIPVIRAAPTSVYFTVFFQELFLNDCCFQRWLLRLTSAQFSAAERLCICLQWLTVSVLKSINSNSDQQVDFEWINLFYHIGMNPKQSDYAVIWLQ